MHTGYTYMVADGTVSDLRTFALRCARGMGACVMMRDDPMDKEPPKQFEPDLSYYNKRLEETQKRLDELAVMTPEQRHEAAEAAWQARLDSEAKYQTEDDTEHQRIVAMHEKVLAWEGAPEGLKEFMLEQLGMSMDRYEGPRKSLLPEKPTTEEWYREEFKRAGEAVGRAAEQIAMEKARTAGRNAWLAQLWASLA